MERKASPDHSSLIAILGCDTEAKKVKSNVAGGACRLAEGTGQDLSGRAHQYYVQNEIRSSPSTVWMMSRSNWTHTDSGADKIYISYTNSPWIRTNVWYWILMTTLWRNQLYSTSTHVLAWVPVQRNVSWSLMQTTDWNWQQTSTVHYKEVGVWPTPIRRDIRVENEDAEQMVED